MGIYNNLLVIGMCWVLTAGLGSYLTFFRQPDQLTVLLKQEQDVKMSRLEVEELLAKEMATESQARQIMARWNARYKLIPDEMETTDVVGYLNSLTSSGYKAFDVTYSGVQPGRAFRRHVFKVTGRGFFTSLYRTVWAIENHRDFYRVENLNLNHFDLTYEDPFTGRPRMEVLVSFSFEVHAFFGGMEGLSADDLGLLSMGNDIVVQPEGDLPPVPASVLPDRQPAKNPFYPLILQSIPPNTDNLPEIEDATLVSIVDGRAVFITLGDKKMVELGVGDPVYLGQITAIDPREGVVVARLNKGGIIDEIEMVLESGERYRQAFGPNMLTPSESR